MTYMEVVKYAEIVNPVQLIPEGDKPEYTELFRSCVEAVGFDEPVM